MASLCSSILFSIAHGCSWQCLQHSEVDAPFIFPVTICIGYLHHSQARLIVLLRSSCFSHTLLDWFSVPLSQSLDVFSPTLLPLSPPRCACVRSGNLRNKISISSGSLLSLSISLNLSQLGSKAAGLSQPTFRRGTCASQIFIPTLFLRVLFAPQRQDLRRSRVRPTPPVDSVYVRCPAPRLLSMPRRGRCRLPVLASGRGRFARGDPTVGPRPPDRPVVCCRRVLLSRTVLHRTRRRCIDASKRRWKAKRCSKTWKWCQRVAWMKGGARM